MFEFGKQYSMQEIETKLAVKKPKYFSFVLTDQNSNKPVAILVRDELNILIGDESSFQFLCIGGYAGHRESEQLVLLDATDRVPLFIIDPQVDQKRYCYVGDYYCIGESTDRQTLGMFNLLVEKIRRDKTDKEYELVKIVCLSKKKPEEVKGSYEVNLPIILNVDAYKFGVTAKSKLTFSFNEIDRL